MKWIARGLFHKKRNQVNEKTSSDTWEKFGHSYKEDKVRMGMLDSVYHLIWELVSLLHIWGRKQQAKSSFMKWHTEYSSNSWPSIVMVVGIADGEGRRSSCTSSQLDFRSRASALSSRRRLLFEPSGRPRLRSICEDHNWPIMLLSFDLDTPTLEPQVSADWLATLLAVGNPMLTVAAALLAPASWKPQTPGICIHAPGSSSFEIEST